MAFAVTLPVSIRFLDDRLGDGEVSLERRREIVDIFRRLAATAQFQNSKGLYIDNATGRIIPLSNKVPESIALQLDHYHQTLLTTDANHPWIWSALQAVNMIKPVGKASTSILSAVTKIISTLSSKRLSLVSTGFKRMCTHPFFQILLRLAFRSS